MRKEYLRYVEEYVDRLEPLIGRLQQENKMELLERKEVTNYSFDRDGVVFKIKVKGGNEESSNLTDINHCVNSEACATSKQWVTREQRDRWNTFRYYSVHMNWIREHIYILVYGFK